MTYFILHKKESKENLMFSSNILGEESLGSFYPAQGWVALRNMIHNQPESLPNFKIFVSMRPIQSAWGKEKPDGMPA